MVGICVRMYLIDVGRSVWASSYLGDISSSNKTYLDLGDCLFENDHEISLKL